jgi:NTP pyrophosphatase (non-canonical NTP hydrolase)
MDPSDYQTQCARTECDNVAARRRMVTPLWSGLEADLEPVRLTHAVMGMVDEVGEIAKLVKGWIYYGKGLDHGAVKEELGDLLWYVALTCNTLGLDMGEVMEANLRKLRVRYPEKFREERADHANRNPAAERQAVDATAESSGGKYHNQGLPDAGSSLVPHRDANQSRTDVGD